MEGTNIGLCVGSLRCERDFDGGQQVFTIDGGGFGDGF
jgi:hypothetical protein